jgi:predicted enzyme related to lactoylglutathione lyase
VTSMIRNVTIDCSDPYALSGFWLQVLGYVRADDDFPGDPECTLLPVDDGRTALVFERVPEQKSVKNRLHLDLQPSDLLRDAEVERVIGLGASLVADHRAPDGAGWAVLADPEGNEFCVLRSAAERAD